MSRVKVGDLVSHTLDSGPPGVGVVVETSEIRPGWAMVWFMYTEKAWWYPLSVLYVKSKKLLDISSAV